MLIRKLWLQYYAIFEISYLFFIHICRYKYIIFEIDQFTISICILVVEEFSNEVRWIRIINRKTLYVFNGYN